MVFFQRPESVKFGCERDYLIRDVNFDGFSFYIPFFSPDSSLKLYCKIKVRLFLHPGFQSGR